MVSALPLSLLIYICSYKVPFGSKHTTRLWRIIEQISTFFIPSLLPSCLCWLPRYQPFHIVQPSDQRVGEVLNVGYITVHPFYANLLDELSINMNAAIVQA